MHVIQPQRVLNVKMGTFHIKITLNASKIVIHHLVIMFLLIF